MLKHINKPKLLLTSAEGKKNNAILKEVNQLKSWDGLRSQIPFEESLDQNAT